MIKKMYLLVSTVLLLSFNATVVYGEQTDNVEWLLEPVVVTSQKQQALEQDVPSSISVVTEKEMHDYQIDTVWELIKHTPNFYSDLQGSQAIPIAEVSIRGISNAHGKLPPVGMYVDDVFYRKLDFELFDADQVEILRGPQGTLYGRNTEAGLIVVRTKEPQGIFSSRLSLAYSSFNTGNIKGHFNVALADNLFLRMAGSYKASDGYFYNKYDDRDNQNSYENVLTSTKLAFYPAENVGLSLFYDYENYDTKGSSAMALADTSKPRLNVDTDHRGYEKSRYHTVSFKANAELDSFDLTSVTTHQQYSFDLDYDSDYSSNPAYVGLWTMYGTGRQYSQEFRAASNDPTDSYKWLYGLFASSDNRKTDMGMTADLYMTGIGANMRVYDTISKSDLTTENLAAFTQMSYEIISGLEIMAGIRYDILKLKNDLSSVGHKINADNGSIIPINDKGSFKKNYNTIMPKLAISYDFNSHVKTYISASRGFKEGGYNDSAKFGTYYKPEYLWSYELGTKTSFEKFNLNVALFYIDWQDKQVANDGGNNSQYTNNAGRAMSKGLEVELTARPIRQLTLNGGFGYTKAEFTKYNPSPNVSYRGNYITNTPEYTAYLGAIYRTDAGYMFSTFYQKTGKFYADPKNDYYQKEYSTVDLKVGFEAKDMEVYLFSKNIFDEIYNTRIVVNDNVAYARQGPPRTVGVEFVAKF